MALPAHLALEIVTPDRAVVHEHVDEVEIPGSDGYFGVLPGHTPMLALLAVGQLWYRKGTEMVYLSIGTGVVEVVAERVIIIARTAEKAEEIDVERAKAALQRGEQRLASRARDIDLERARLAILKALTRLNVATRTRTRA
jgi:F-type H+-transporting ATPase subunit epsilon